MAKNAIWCVTDTRHNISKLPSAIQDLDGFEALQYFSNLGMGEGDTVEEAERVHDEQFVKLTERSRENNLN